MPPIDASEGQALRDRRLGAVLNFFRLIGIGGTSLIWCKGLLAALI